MSCSFPRSPLIPSCLLIIICLGARPTYYSYISLGAPLMFIILFISDMSMSDDQSSHDSGLGSRCSPGFRSPRQEDPLGAILLGSEVVIRIPSPKPRHLLPWGGIDMVRITFDAALASSNIICLYRSSLSRTPSRFVGTPFWVVPWALPRRTSSNERLCSWSPSALTGCPKQTFLLPSTSLPRPEPWSVWWLTLLMMGMS